MTEKVRRLERQRDAAQVPKRGKGWTVESWLLHWLENIARPSLRETSYSAYRSAVKKHLVPGVGGHRLDGLEPEHLERLYRRMVENGSRPATAHQVHRTARTAFGEAVRRGHMPRNPAALAKAPKVTQELVDPYSVVEVQRILAEADKRRNSAMGTGARAAPR